MLRNVVEEVNAWVFRGPFGNETRITRSRVIPDDVQIGLLGTLVRPPFTKGRAPGRRGKTDLLIAMLKSLNRPILLIDTRRSGVGAQSSWDPEIFASRIPAALGFGNYDYYHVPSLAPSSELLKGFSKDRKEGGPLAEWDVFRDQYREEILGRESLNDGERTSCV